MVDIYKNEGGHFAVFWSRATIAGIFVELTFYSTVLILCSHSLKNPSCFLRIKWEENIFHLKIQMTDTLCIYSDHRTQSGILL